MTNPGELSRALRTGTDPDLVRRRWMVGLSLFGAAMGGVVSAYQMGMIRRLPDPPVGPFDSERVDASDYAYKRLETPDGLLMIGTYAVTAILAGAGAPDRSRTRPWLPLAMAAKAAFDVATNARLAREEWAENEALCVYCQAANVASLATAALALPEAARAVSQMRGSNRPFDEAPAASEPRPEHRASGDDGAEHLLDEALEDTFPASDPPAYMGSTLPKTAHAPARP